MQSTMLEGAPSEAPPRSSPWPAVLLVAALVLTYLITHALLLSRFPWFIDETIFANFAQAVEGDRSQRFAALSDHKGLLNTWIAAVFIHLGAAPVEAMRLLSLLSGIVAAGATGLLVSRWRGARDGYLAGALTLFVPWLFVHGAVGVYDEFIAAGSMIALGLQLSFARQPRLDRALLLGITFGMLVLSKPTGALPIALLPLSLGVFDWRSEGVRRRLAAWAGGVALALFIALAMYALTRLSPLAYTPAPDNIRSLGDALSDPFGVLSETGPGVFEAVVGYMTPPVLAAALWGCWRVVATRDVVGLILIAWTLAALAAFIVLTNDAYPRYGLQMAAPLCALAVVGGVDLWERLQQRWSNRVAWAVTAVALSWLLVLDAWVVIAPNHAPYPGLDTDQYRARRSNVQPERAAAEAIIARAGAQRTPQMSARDRTVAVLTFWPFAAELALNGDKFSTNKSFTAIHGDAPSEALNDARYVIITEGSPAGLKLDPDDLVKSWSRPSNGEPIGGFTTRLYDRGE